MARRYVCPICGVGRLAPSRMGPKDVRRFCLDCSQDTGQLVDMSCPARDRAAAQRIAKQREAAKAQREKERAKEAEQYLLKDGTDLRTILKRVKGLKVWPAEGPQVARAVKNHHNVSVHENQSADDAAMRVIEVLARVGYYRLPGRASENETNYRALLMTAAQQYFGLTPNEMAEAVNLSKGTKRLTKEDHRWGWEWAIKQVLKARTK